MKKIDRLILDMDGVLWHGETPLPRLHHFFQGLDKLGLPYALATNNATRTGRMYVEKLAKFGIDVPADRIVTSAEATAAYLRRHHEPGTLIYVLGEEGLHEALRSQGFETTGADGYAAEDDITLVVVGWSRHACFRQMAGAALHIRGGARFIGTNPDRTFPSELGFVPGAGSYLAFLEAATDQAPTVIGKPGPTLFEEALRRLGAADDDLRDMAARTGMVGDRLETDIAGGQAAGLQTILLLSGVSKREQLKNSDTQPDYIYDDIHAMLAALQQRDR